MIRDLKHWILVGDISKWKGNFLESEWRRNENIGNSVSSPSRANMQCLLVPSNLVVYGYWQGCRSVYIFSGSGSSV